MTMQNAAPVEGTLPHLDLQRLGALFQTLQPRLTAVALRLTRDPDSARDVVQSAFEKALRHRAQFRGQSRVSTWLHRIVANEALMWLRSENRRGKTFSFGDAYEFDAIEPGPDPSEGLIQREHAARLHREIAELPRDEREVVRRCGLGGLSYSEYATRSGQHPAAIKSRAFRARQRLRRALDPA